MSVFISSNRLHFENNMPIFIKINLLPNMNPSRFFFPNYYYYYLYVGSYKKLFHPLTGLVFHLVGVTCHPPHQQKTVSGGAGLDTNHWSMQQVVLGYTLPVAGLSLTWPFWLQEMTEEKDIPEMLFVSVREKRKGEIEEAITFVCI